MSVTIGHRTVVELLRGCCPPQGLVVDAGAFPGGLTRQLKQVGWTVVALDKDPERGVSMQERFKAGESLEDEALGTETTFFEAMREIGVEVRATDLESTALPFATDTVDAVVLTEVIEHLWVDPLFALSEMNRVLKGGTGVLVLSTPNFLSLRNRVNFLRGRMNRVIEHPFVAYLKKSRLGHTGHVRLYAPVELESMLKLLGFEPRFHFFSFDYWDAVPGGGGQPGRDQPSAPSQAAGRRNGWARKIFRSPASYAHAAVATTREWLEQAVPAFRSHMFVVARKVTHVDYRNLALADVNALVGSDDQSLE
jgi:SAM-dependent methyltransferase